MSRAPSSNAPHGNRATQSSRSQAHGNIRSGNARNTTSTNLGVVAAHNVDNTHNTPTDDDVDDHSDASNTNAGVVRRRSRLNNAQPDPTQLRFYSGSWVDVLKNAKYQYRLCIHTDEPFPERSPDSLSDAHECLLEAIGKFQDEMRLPLDEGS